MITESQKKQIVNHFLRLPNIKSILEENGEIGDAYEKGEITWDEIEECVVDLYLGLRKKDNFIAWVKYLHEASAKETTSTTDLFNSLSQLIDDYKNDTMKVFKNEL